MDLALSYHSQDQLAWIGFAPFPSLSIPERDPWVVLGIFGDSGYWDERQKKLESQPVDVQLFGAVTSSLVENKAPCSKTWDVYGCIICMDK